MDTDTHELVGAYALDALPDEERRFFERHLASCAACRAEVDELQATASRLGDAAAEAPPAALRERVLAAAPVTPQEPAQEAAPAAPLVPVGAPATAPTPPAPVERRVDRLRRLLPAVAAVIVLGAAGLVALATQTPSDPAEGRLAQLITAPDAELLDLAAPAGTTARFVWSAQRGEGLLVTEGLAAAPDGHAYALWVIDEDAPALVGMFRPDERGHAAHTVTEGLAGAVAVAVTVEPAEGVDAPTTEPLIVGEL